MSNVRFIMDNAVDHTSAVITDGNANILASLPVTNVQLPQRTKAVRTSNTSDMVLLFNWGGATKRIDGGGMLRHNLSSTATWRVQLYDGENQTGSLIYDSTATLALPPANVDDENWTTDTTITSTFHGWDNGDKFSTFWEDTIVTALSARITVSDASNTDGYLQVGRVFLGVSAKPAINVSIGLQGGWNEKTKQFRTEGGTLRSDPKPIYRSFSLGMDQLTHGERGGFSELIKKVGMREDFLVDVFPDGGGAQERDFTMSCKFSVVPRFTQSSFDRHKVTFNLIEA